MDQGIPDTGPQFVKDHECTVIFSLVDGFVWMSQAGGNSMVQIGPYESVLAGMQDFIAQSELGERLANRA